MPKEMNKATRVALALIAFVALAAFGIVTSTLGTYAKLWLLKEFGFELP